MSTAQQAKVSLSIIETILAIADKHQRQAVEVGTEDLQALADEVKRQKQLLEWAARIIDSGVGAGILRYDPVQWFIDYHTGGKP